MVYYPVPLHRMRIFEGRSLRGDELKESERAAQEVLSLPIEPLMGKDSVEYVIETIRGFSAQ